MKVSSARAGESTVLHPHIFGQLLFQLLYLRPHDISAARNGLQHGLVHVLLEDLILLLKISKLHGFAFARPIDKANNYL